jgi:hypothetical protein
MKANFPEVDLAALRWVNILERDGTVRSDVLSALIDEFVNAEDLVVEVTRNLGDFLPRHEVISYVEKMLVRAGSE